MSNELISKDEITNELVNEIKDLIMKARNKAIEFKLKKNQKVIRLVAMREYKNYLAKPEGKLHLGLVTHSTTKERHK